MNIRNVFRYGTTVAVLVVSVFLGSSGAYAHMGIASSNPANGSQLEVAPRQASLTFSVAVELDSAEAQLRYLGGVDTPITEANRRDVKTEQLIKSSGSGQGSTAAFELPSLAAGLYAIDWSVDEIGGHNNLSSIIFKVTEGSNGNPTKLYGAVGTVSVVFLTGFILFLKRRNS